MGLLFWFKPFQRLPSRVMSDISEVTQVILDSENGNNLHQTEGKQKKNDHASFFMACTWDFKDSFSLLLSTVCCMHETMHMSYHLPIFVYLNKPIKILKLKYTCLYVWYYSTFGSFINVVRADSFVSARVTVIAVPQPPV